VVGGGGGGVGSDGDGVGDTVADGGGVVVRGAVVRGGVGVDAAVVGAGAVADAVATALGVGLSCRPVRGDAAALGRPGGTAGAAGLAGAADGPGDWAASVGTGNPGPCGRGEGEDAGRSATVAPTKASTTTTAPTAAPISAIRRRRPAPAGSSTYRSREADVSRPLSVDTRSRTRARPSLIRRPTPRHIPGARLPGPTAPSRPVRGYHALFDAPTTAP
jgi:hypothetical protein